MTAFGELQEQRRPVPARRRRYLALAGVATAAAALTAVVAVFQTDSKPAYALSPNGDGSVTFTINDTSDPEGATRALQQAGIHAVVMPGHRPGGCPADERGVRDGRRFSSLRTAVDTLEYRWAHPEATHSMVIRPDNIPAGTVLVIGTATTTPLPDGTNFMTYPELFQNPGPKCYELPFDPDDAPATPVPSASQR